MTAVYVIATVLLTVAGFCVAFSGRVVATLVCAALMILLGAVIKPLVLP